MVSLFHIIMTMDVLQIWHLLLLSFAQIVSRNSAYGGKFIVSLYIILNKFKEERSCVNSKNVGFNKYTYPR